MFFLFFFCNKERTINQSGQVVQVVTGWLSPQLPNPNVLKLNLVSLVSTKTRLANLIVVHISINLIVLLVMLWNRKESIFVRKVLGFQIQIPLNKVTEVETLLASIREMFSSNIGRDISCTDGSLSWFSSVFRTCRHNLNGATAGSFQILSSLSFTIHPVIRWYVIRDSEGVEKSVLNKILLSPISV